MAWIIDKLNNGYPHLENVTHTDCYVLAEPYPTRCMRVNEKNSGYPYLPELIGRVGSAMQYPYPNQSFRIDSRVNGGYPYLNFLYTMGYCSRVKQSDKILLYDMAETDFSHFGLRILTPTMCKITEEYNGLYELELEHPIDEEGTWHMIDELDIIKAKGQLFRIYRVIRKMNSDGTKSISVNARHIFYDLNDMLLIDVRPTNCTATQAVSWLINNARGCEEASKYSYQSDIKDKNTSYFENMSVTEALIGADNSILKRWGGELYRDNFHFSIMKRREKSKDNAFNIRYSLNMFEIEENIDYSEAFTYLIAKSNFGDGLSKFMTNEEKFAPHHIYKFVKFTYDEETYSKDAFFDDVRAYFYDMRAPKITYKVSIADISNQEMYKDFVNLSRYEVGDKGYIYNEKLGISTEQMIIKKVYDVINNCTESVELGNLKNYYSRIGRYSNTTSGNSLNDKLQDELYKLHLKTLETHRNISHYTHAELTRFTNNEIGGRK